jgi:hypothetical protein
MAKAIVADDVLNNATAPIAVICREVRRNGVSELYRATSSDEAARDRAQRPKLGKWLAVRP